jgi:hypothetical protein
MKAKQVNPWPKAMRRLLAREATQQARIRAAKVKLAAIHEEMRRMIADRESR